MLQRNNSEFNRTSNFNGSITMARLNQNQNNLTFYQGWYGICAEDESDCADFNLINGTGSSASKKYTQIHAIYEARPDTFGQVSYNGNTSDGMLLDYQQIKSLKCGSSYLIVLKKGDGYLDIENFVPASSNSGNYRVVSSCEVEDNATPKPSATPTPKKTATPTPKKTATPTPKPQPTPTPKKTATPTPKAEPTPTPVPKKDWKMMGASITSDQTNDYSGYSISMSETGTTIAIGAIYNNEAGLKSGKTTVYSYDGSSWKQKGSAIKGKNKYDYSGVSVALCRQGNNLIIGTPYDDAVARNSGTAKVYTFENNDWKQVGSDINGEQKNDQNGRSVAMSGNGQIIAVGRLENYTGGNGSVRVYQLTNGNWVLRGSAVKGDSEKINFGYNIDLSSMGNALAVGAPNSDEGGTDKGAVHIYNFNGSAWVKTGKFLGESSADRFARCVSFNYGGTMLAVGTGYNDGSGTSSGHVRVYILKNNSWQQHGSDIDGEAKGDASGESVALSGDGTKVVIGSPWAKNSGDQYPSGEARVFEWRDNNWKKLGITIDGKQNAEFSGISVAINLTGDTIAISNNPGVKSWEGTSPAKSYVNVYKLTAENSSSATPKPQPTPTPKKTATPTPKPSATPTPKSSSKSTICDTIGADVSINTKSGTSVSGGGVNATGTTGKLCFKAITPKNEMKNYLISLGGENYEEGGIQVNVSGVLNSTKFGFIRASDGKEYVGDLAKESEQGKNKNVFNAV